MYDRHILHIILYPLKFENNSWNSPGINGMIITLRPTLYGGMGGGGCGVVCLPLVVGRAVRSSGRAGMCDPNVHTFVNLID